MSRIIRRITKPFRSLATGGAWFFVVVSLLHLAWAVDTKWAEPAGVAKLYHTVVGGVSYDAWGLTYDGYVGLWTAFIQGTVVLAAAAATLLPGRRLLVAQRVGHVILLGWATLWAGNLLWLAGIDQALDSAAQASLVSILLLCTAGRTVFGWNPSPRASKPEPPSAPSARQVQDTSDTEEFGMQFSDQTSSEPSFWTGVGTRLDRLVHWTVHQCKSFWAWIVKTLEKFRDKPPSTPRPETVMHAARARTAGGLKKFSRMLDRQADRLEAHPAQPAPPVRKTV